MKPMKKIALLHSLCGVGKASLTNMMPIFAVMGFEACPIPTTVLSTHTGGFDTPAKQAISPEYIRNCAEHYRDNNIEFDAIFVGYLGSAEMVSAVGYFLEQFPNATKILDPVMGDHGKCYSNVNETYIQSFRKLLPLVDVVLPNLTEACFLSGHTYCEDIATKDFEGICSYFHQYNVQHVIITSARSDLKQRGVVLSDGTKTSLLMFDAKQKEFHGTGDVFDAVFISSYLEKYNVNQSVIRAHEFVSACIEESSKFDYETKEGLLIENNLSMLV